jgi:hypothetical protein
MDIPKKLKDEIWDYCRLNDITDLDGFILKSVKSGFNIAKFGNSPFDIEPEVIEKIVEKEVIKEVEVEKIVEKKIEIPVEKVVVKEVIKEVPVEKVVEKEVYITDDEQVGELTVKIETLNRKISDLGSEIKQKEKENKELEREYRSDLENYEEGRRLLMKELAEKPKEVVDEKHKKFWEDEVESHNKTKEEITKLQKQIDTLKKELESERKGGKSDFYGEGGKRKGEWWK